MKSTASLIALLALATSPIALAEEGPPDASFEAQLANALSQSKLTLNSRLRWELAKQGSESAALARRTSNAFTVRTRFGLTTAPLHGFQLMLEGEDVSVIGPRDLYNAAGSNLQPDRTIIADPPTSELNQAWLAYSNFDSVLRAGRQRIVLDNQRFIGDVGWRQNQQTYDAVSFENRSVEGLSVFYAYLWRVNRIFGNVAELPAGNLDFESASHLVNVSYAGWKPARFTGYAYLLDFANAPANSTATYGLSASGSQAFGDAGSLKLDYRGEFAWQTAFGGSPLDFGAPYSLAALGASYSRYALGAGYEVLGSDGTQAVKTPLATLHAHNGWADVFLATPALGLRDLYGFAQVTLAAKVPLRLVYHAYRSASGEADYGQELDAVVSTKLGKHLTVLAKYAYFMGGEAIGAAPAPIDVHRLWVQLEFDL